MIAGVDVDVAAVERIHADDVFALSPAMKRYLEHEAADKLRARGRQQGLVDAVGRRRGFGRIAGRNAARA